MRKKKYQVGFKVQNVEAMGPCCDENIAQLNCLQCAEYFFQARVN